MPFTVTRIVTPIHGAHGDVELLELSAREVTPIIEKFRSMTSQDG